MLDRLIGSEPYGRLIRELGRARDAGAPRVWAGGIWGSAAPMVCAALASRPARGLESPPAVLLVTAHLDQADDALEDAELFADGPAALLAGWASRPTYGQAGDEIAAERLALCRKLLDAGGERPRLIVAPVQALMQPAPQPGALRRAMLSLSAGEEISPDAVAAWLADHGYARVEVVDVPGDFAVRGGIVDILPAELAGGLRLDFFGDRIESIRTFDPDDQRSRDPIDAVELVGSFAEPAPGTAACFLDYLPDGAVVAFADPEQVEQVGAAYLQRLDNTAGLIDVHALLRPSGRLTQLMLTGFAPDGGGEPAVEFGCASLQRFETASADAVGELARLADDQDVVVYCDNKAEQDRLGELLAEQAGGTPARLSMRLGFLHAGFRYPAGGFLLVGHHEIFHRYRTRHRVRRVRTGRPLDSFLDLELGDDVVHVVHGVARYRGTQQLTRDGRTEEFLTLEFAGRATLHVPVTQIHLVHKYIGAFKGRPKLSTLGGRAWAGKKAQVAQAVSDLAAELLAVQARRQSEPGVAYPPDSPLQREFEDSFIYTETDDQLKTAGEIKKDLQARRPMDRLLCGDVGYGKTELAIRAAFKVVEAGKQVAVLVPTTVLAEQHERTFRERLADYPLTVESISRFRTGAQARDILARTADGRLDVLVGTHRLLSDDVRFRDLGLLVIDEEQRFGVSHKEKLKGLRATLDVLTMTATPIPRTLHLSMLGLRDISALATPPLDRRAIHTEVVRFHPDQVRAAIVRELNRDGQVYFVHNRVHNIQSVADRLAQIVPEARIIVGHGQMHGRELEKVMLTFVRGQADVLVCTTIIESGVDIPNVNTIFIHEADRFGLAELHQLRGRVGRYKHKAFCYLMLPERRAMTPNAARRLKAVEEFSELGAGFRIALRDLEIRGAGNILGPEQSGHIAAVGYEMYCQLLDAAVRKLRGEPADERPQTHLDLGIGGLLPRSYIPADRQRMEVYRRLAACREDRDIEQLESDLADAYGPPPPEARNLIDQTQLRIWAARAAIRAVNADPPDLVFSIDDMAAARGALTDAPGIVRVIDEKTVHLRLTDAYFEPATLLAVLRKCLRPRAAPANERGK